MNGPYDECSISCKAESSCCLETCLHPDILRYIFTFLVGGYEYRYMSIISKTFHHLYIEQYPDKLTSVTLAGLSVYHANVFYNEANTYCFQKFRWYRCSTVLKKIEYILKFSILNGNVDVVEWIFENVKEMNYYYSNQLKMFAFQIAAKTGRKDSLQSIFVDKWKYDIYFCRKAVQDGNLQLVKNLLEIGFLTPKTICVTAARKGHVDILKYLHQRGCKLTRKVIDAAITNDQVECIEYCSEQGVKPSDRWKFVS